MFATRECSPVVINRVFDMEAGAGKGVFITTFGCQMNEYDSKRMEEALYPEYRLVASPEDADIILINTCSIREKAEHKVYSLVGRYRALKHKRPELIIGVGGCVAQQEGERLIRRLPFLDLVFGPQGLYRLRDAIDEIEQGRGPVVLTDMEDAFEIPPPSRAMPTPSAFRAYVTIMQGCDNFCTYCVVPYVRGREVSRPKGDILKEIEALVASGVKDITLLGQNVNSYGKKQGLDTTFAGLLLEVAGMPGLERLRFTTSHPKDFTDDVIEAMATGPPVCDHIHLPVQSGSNRMLKRMNRKYTREHYLHIIHRIKDRLPDISITTDVIVGFPGETKQDFDDTISLLKEVQFDQIFSFKYSPRPFTAAAGFDDQIDEETKQERLSAVIELQKEIGLNRLSRFQGRVVEVLVESVNPNTPGELIGRTTGNHVVNFEGPEELVGKKTELLVERACYHSLRGMLR